MYRQENKGVGTLQSQHPITKGEPLIRKVMRVLVDKEPIEDGAPMIYTDRADGVLPGTNVRTDRFEIAVEAMNQIHKGNIARSKMNMEAAQKTASGKQIGESGKSPESGGDSVAKS